MPQQQDPQRYFSPGPSSEQPPQSGPGFGGQYPPSAPPNGPAPFHFIPGGVQDQPQAQQPSVVGRKPTPQQAAAEQYPGGPSAPPPSGGFQGQVRPHSIHTLNSGNPQELGTGGYESPIDNRHSSGMPAAVGGYDPYAPQPPQQQQRPDLSSQVQQMSLESPTSVYSPQQPQMPEHSAPPPPQQQAPAPPQGGYQAYQAYQPPQQQQAQPQPQGQQGMAGGDPGDFYR